MENRSGFTLMEILIVVTIIGLLASFAGPSLLRLRASAGLQSGRAQLTAALSLARATSARMGRTSVLTIDTAEGVLTVSVDTGSVTGSSDPWLAREYRITDDLGVRVGSNRRTLCFDARGIGTIAVGCPEAGAVFTLASGGVVDTVRINSAGRVWR